MYNVETGPKDNQMQSVSLLCLADFDPLPPSRVGQAALAPYQVIHTVYISAAFGFYKQYFSIVT